MKFIAALLVTLMTTCSCTSMYGVDGIINLEPSIQEHINNFYLDKLVHLGTKDAFHTIEFRFETLLGNMIGECEFRVGDNKPRVVRIDPEFWYNATDSAREQLVYHELGHCDLDIGQVHSGIMRPNPVSNYHYESQRESLIRELFDYSTNPDVKL